MLHIIFALVGAVLVFLYSPAQLLLFINGHNAPWLDKLMYHITRLPEIAYIIFVLFLGIFTQKRYAIAIFISLVLCGLIIVLTKFLIFSGETRPSVWLLENKIPFHAVEGITLYSHGSFPSGHTIASFCTLALAAFISKKWWVQFLFFALAFASAYSRVYVLQHYFIDIYVGAIIGFVISFVCFSIIESKFHTPEWQKPFIKI